MPSIGPVTGTVVVAPDFNFWYNTKATGKIGGRGTGSNAWQHTPTKLMGHLCDE